MDRSHWDLWEDGIEHASELFSTAEVRKLAFWPGSRKPSSCIEMRYGQSTNSSNLPIQIIFWDLPLLIISTVTILVQTTAAASSLAFLPPLLLPTQSPQNSQMLFPKHQSNYVTPTLAMTQDRSSFLIAFKALHCLSHLWYYLLSKACKSIINRYTRVMFTIFSITLFFVVVE